VLDFIVHYLLHVSAPIGEDGPLSGPKHVVSSAQ
jgi:hypothetical protein